MCNLFIQIYNDKVSSEKILDTVKPVIAMNISSVTSECLIISHNDASHILEVKNKNV
jgi:hypothetical protein